MGRETWKCPHPNCNQESSRFWNLMRHIKRFHNGEGIPVKNKSDIEITAHSTQYFGNIKDPYPRNSPATEISKKIQGVNTTREIDPTDTIYQMYRKYRDRNDKIEEMMNYFAKNSSKIRFSPEFPHSMFNNGKPENAVPYQFWSDFTPASVPPASEPTAPISSTSNMPHAGAVRTKMVLGYLEHICNYCLEFEALQVMYDPNASDKISWTHHTCDPEILNTAMAYPTFAREDVLFYRTLDSSNQMINAVKEWTKGKVFLISEKLTFSEAPKSTITLDLDLRKNEYNWLTRAIVQKYTILDNMELKEFFNLVPEWCATFYCVWYNFVEKEGQQDVKQELYCLWLSYGPSLPWELR
jgi:hypothetical protein